MEAVAFQEDLPIDYIKTMVAQGKIVIPWNSKRKPKAVGIGKGLRTKVNASIGTSSDIIDYAAEVRKAKIAVAAGADTLMELSVGGDLDRVRREVIAAVDIPVGNVPLYQAFCEAGRKYGNPNKLDEEMLFDQRIHQRLAPSATQAPQPLHLRKRQVQARHVQVLRADLLEPSRGFLGAPRSFLVANSNAISSGTHGSPRVVLPRAPDYKRSDQIECCDHLTRMRDSESTVSR